VTHLDWSACQNARDLGGLPTRYGATVEVPIEGVVFDFDGLLMDTETTLVESWRAEWRWHGLELDVDDGFFPGHGGDTLEMHYEKLAAVVGGRSSRAGRRGRLVRPDRDR